MTRTAGRGIPWLALLFAACWVFPAIDFSLQVYDEGSLLLGARAVLHGGMPLKDFWTAYPPGMFWLLALAFRIFGEQVLVNRLLHAAFLVGICIVSYYLVLRVSGSRRWALLGFTLVTLYAGAVRTNYGYPPVVCTLLALLGFLALFHGPSERSARHSFAAGLSAALCAIVRYDLAIYLVAASFAAMGAGLLSATGRSRSGQLAKQGAIYATGLLIPVLVAYGLVIAEVGAARTYALLVDFPLRIFPRVRSFPFSWPFAILGNAPRGAWSRAVLLLYEAARVPLVLPFLAAPAGVVAGLVLVVARPLERVRGALLLGLSALAIALINQLRVRSFDTQGWPLAVVGLVVTVSLLSVVAESPGPLLRAASRGCAFVLCLVLVPATAYREFLWLRARYWAQTAPVSSRWAAGIRIPADQADYNKLLAFLADRRPDGGYLYSGVVDHDQLVFNDVLVYFLSGLRSPTFFSELAPGVVDTREAQTEIVRGLEEHAVQTVLLYDYVSSEPNESSINKHVEIADTFIRTHFRTVARFQSYAVLKRQEQPVP